MTLDIGARQLRNSFVEHRSSSDTIGPTSSRSAALLLFYGVECGLKAAILRRQNLRDTSLLEAALRSHDLRALAKELNMAPVVSRALVPCDSRSAQHPKVPVTDLHQAWRYGHDLDGPAEKLAIVALNGVADWCAEELRVM